MSSTRPFTGTSRRLNEDSLNPTRAETIRNTSTENVWSAWFKSLTPVLLSLLYNGPNIFPISFIKFLA